MLDAWYKDKMTCANCRLIIHPKSKCYLAEIPGEAVCCSKTCAKIIEKKYEMEDKIG